MVNTLVRQDWVVIFKGDDGLWYGSVDPMAESVADRQLAEHAALGRQAYKRRHIRHIPSNEPW